LRHFLRISREDGDLDPTLSVVVCNVQRMSDFSLHSCCICCISVASGRVPRLSKRALLSYPRRTVIGMQKPALEHLTASFSQYLVCRSAGVARLVIDDGYQAIDNAFSAVLIQKGIDPSFNHRYKLDRFCKEFAPQLQAASIDPDQLKAFLKAWKEVRYAHDEVAADDALKYLRLASDCLQAIWAFFAGIDGVTSDEIEECLYVAVLGGKETSFANDMEYLHRVWSDAIDRSANSGPPDRLTASLGEQLMNPANYCEIHSLADDRFTRQLILDDEEFGILVGAAYAQFLELVQYVRVARYEAGMEASDAPAFNLSLRFRYHGEAGKDVADQVGRAVLKWFRAGGPMQKRAGSSRKWQY
jgi:hypothetical protein